MKSFSLLTLLMAICCLINLLFLRAAIKDGFMMSAVPQRTCLDKRQNPVLFCFLQTSISLISVIFGVWVETGLERQKHPKTKLIWETANNDNKNYLAPGTLAKF